MTARGEEISMIYATTLKEGAGASASGSNVLSIIKRFLSLEMRESAGYCFVQVDVSYGAAVNFVTAKDYL